MIPGEDLLGLGDNFDVDIFADALDELADGMPENEANKKTTGTSETSPTTVPPPGAQPPPYTQAPTSTGPVQGQQPGVPGGPAPIRPPPPPYSGPGPGPKVLFLALLILQGCSFIISYTD